MPADEPESARSMTCEACGKVTPAFDVVSYGSIEGGYRQLCSHCYNAEVARVSGLAHFDNVRFEPVVMTDGAGQAHTFHFRARLLGEKVAIDAFEIKDDLPAGYQFQMLGDVDDDLLALLGRLIERMRRQLSVQDLEQTRLGLQIAGQSVRGRIEWDDDTDGLLPLVSAVLKVV